MDPQIRGSEDRSNTTFSMATNSVEKTRNPWPGDLAWQRRTSFTLPGRLNLTLSCSVMADFFPICLPHIDHLQTMLIIILTGQAG